MGGGPLDRGRLRPVGGGQLIKYSLLIGHLTTTLTSDWSGHLGRFLLEPDGLHLLPQRGRGLL